MSEQLTFNEKLFNHWKKVEVRFRDLDTLNHVNNAIFSTYFEEARIHFLHSFPELGSTLGTENSFVLVRICIDYKSQVQYPSTLIIGSKVKNVGNTSITTQQACYDNETKEVRSVAESVLVWYNIERQRPVRLPDINDLKSFQG
ncbi:MAG TPA: thioesterase family protein [Balneolales bacterium]|nr:thioesterase family protein [Balneolales bacterium]